MMSAFKFRISTRYANQPTYIKIESMLLRTTGSHPIANEIFLSGTKNVINKTNPESGYILKLPLKEGILWPVSMVSCAALPVKAARYQKRTISKERDIRRLWF